MSRRILAIKPDGWPCRFADCPPGFFTDGESLCLKSEYHGEDGFAEAFNEAGEYYWGGATDKNERDALIVQPCVPAWIEADE